MTDTEIDTAESVITSYSIHYTKLYDILRRTPPGKNGELQITDALQTQANEGMVLAYRFDGRRFDCGSFEGFVEATNYFYKQRQTTG